MSSYKLTYFNIRARGEVPRYMFKLKSVDFEDNRIAIDAWPQHKASKHARHAADVTGRAIAVSVLRSNFSLLSIQT